MASRSLKTLVLPLAALLIGACAALVPAEGSRRNPVDFQTFRLANGIPVVLERHDDAPIVHIVLALRAGSKYEPEGRMGLAHLLEHLILFGGDATGVAETPAALRQRGGFMNGHTDRDLVTLELTLPARELAFGIDMLVRRVFRRRFLEGDLKRERKVVRREWSEMVDSPDLRGLHRMLGLLFPGHPYGRSTFGTEKDLERIDLITIQQHYRILYRPERCGVALVGDLDLSRARKILDRALGTLKPGDEAAVTEIAPPPSMSATQEIVLRMDVRRAHVFIGFRAPAYSHPDRVALRVLTWMLGRGGYPLLGTRLSGRFNLVDALSMHYLALEQGGCAWIHLILDPRRVERACSETMRFLKAFRNMNFSRRDFPPSQRRGVFDFLETAVNQLEMESESGGESGLHRALTYARFLMFRRDGRTETFQRRITKLTPSRLRGIAGKYLLGAPWVRVTIMPGESR